MRPWLLRMRRGLIEPAAGIDDPEQRRRMQWLSLALACVLPWVIVGALVEQGLVAISLRVFLVVLLAAYLLSRTRYYHAAVATTLAALLVQSASAVVATGEIATREQALFAYIWLLIPLAVSALFLPARGVLAAAGAVALAIVGHAALIEGLAFPLYGPSLALLLITTIITASSLDMRAKELQRIREQALELGRAKVAAEAATRAKAAFLANMSHELRTPMNGIQGMINLTMEGELRSEQREALTVVQQSGDALMALVNDILDYSKLDAEHVRLEVSAFALRECLEDAAESIRARTEAKGIDVRFVWDDAAPEHVCTDRPRLRQVIDGLLDNAAKFTERGAIELAVRARSMDVGRAVIPACEESDPRAGFELVLEIADTGRGISDAERERLFEVFVQGDASSTRRHAGTGLGLAISKRLITLMGGRIELSSKLGVGTTFTLTVPVAGVTAAAAERLSQAKTRTAREVRAPQEPRADEPLSVLLVEDNPLNRRVAIAMLKRLGYEAAVAEDGREAVDAVRSQHYDVILMDVQMPVMDGLEATRHIRTLVDHARQPYIVAVTAHTLQGDREDCLAAGMDAYLGKPFRLNDLERILRTRREHPFAGAATA